MLGSASFDMMLCRSKKTRSTKNVAHFRFFVSERRGSLRTQIVGMPILISGKKSFVDSGHGIIRCDAN